MRTQAWVVFTRLARCECPKNAHFKTQGFSDLLSTDEKKEISTSLLPEGGGKKLKKSFREITREALKKRRKNR